MKRALALALLLAGCGRAPDDFAFRNVSVTLPDDSVTLPARTGADAVAANCGACHSVDMILNQPRLSRAQWQATIAKMKTVFKAPVDPAAEPAILAYLEATSAALPRQIRP